SVRYIRLGLFPECGPSSTVTKIILTAVIAPCSVGGEGVAKRAAEHTRNWLIRKLPGNVPTSDVQALVLVVVWFIVLLFARLRYGSWRRFIEAINAAERRQQK